jgi:hypothetical protein
MIEIIAVYLVMSILISLVSIREDMISKGYNPNARDGDKDGLVQEGTRWERKI